MKILIISGSKNPEGQTAKVTKAFIEGLISEKSQAEEIFLPKMKIERCRQCENDGWGTCMKKNQCTIDDDFASVVDKIKNADAVIFATAVYFSDLSESLRAFLDRLRRITVHGTGKKIINGKPAIGICVAGGGGGGAPTCTVRLENILNTCGFDILDMVPARRQNLDMKTDVLKITGKWLAKRK